MEPYSSHIMMFPFKWEIKQKNESVFGKRHHLSNISPVDDSPWHRKVMNYNEQEKIELYNEKNFFYEFVHNSLYDTGQEPQPVLHHFERKEALNGQTDYEIGIKQASSELSYKLNIRSLTLDLYSSGVGILNIYLDNFQYSLFEEVKNINYYGSRIFPRYWRAGGDPDNDKDKELADRLSITGLNGDAKKYTEDFSTIDPSHPRETPRFLDELIKDLNPALEAMPVIDDSMFTLCWYFNDSLAQRIEDEDSYKKFVAGKDWYSYVHATEPGADCQISKTQAVSLEGHTYSKWQHCGTLYGITRKSFMVISKNNNKSRQVWSNNFSTIYARLVSLALMQRISIMKFSAEVTSISTLAMDNDTRMVERIDDFYMAYIRFVNQSHFLEVTGQQYGIELYDLLLYSMRIKDQVQDLDNEVEELHKFSIVLEKKAQGRSIKLLTLLGSLFLVPSFIAGFYGMNLFPDEFKENIPLLQAVTILILLIAGGLWGILSLSRQENRRFVNFLLAAVLFMVILVMGLSLWAAMRA